MDAWLPKTALTTWLVSQVGDLVEEDEDASVIDDCRDSCPTKDPSSEGESDGIDEDDDIEDTFLDRMSSHGLVASTPEM